MCRACSPSASPARSRRISATSMLGIAGEPTGRFHPPARGCSTPVNGDESRVFVRVSNLTDGVFAIAVTLLAFGLEVPISDHDLTRHVLELWPDLLAYFLSFAVVGRFWILHHRFFATLERFDRRLLT